MKIILPIIASFSGGLLVGGAYVAFITLIKLFPRLVQFTETKKYLKYYEMVFAASALITTVVYFSNFSLSIGKSGILIIGIFFGIFTGAFSAALAEVLNIIPLLANRLKLHNHIKLLSASLVLGKVCGAIYYFIYFLGG